MNQPNKQFYQLPSANPTRTQPRFKKINEMSLFKDLYEEFGKGSDDGLDKYRLQAGWIYGGSDIGWIATIEQKKKFINLMQ